MTTNKTTDALLPCSMCGAFEINVHENLMPPTMNGKKTVVSCDITHWCKTDGLPRTTIKVTGRDKLEAIAAWNTRAQPKPAQCPLGEDCDLTIAYMKGFSDGKADRPKPAQGDSVLSGYVLMPDEPTGEIEDEFDAHYSYGFYEAYRAMINAGKNQQIDKHRTQSDAIREWDYLLGEISANHLILHDGTLDILNNFIRAALTDQRAVDVESLKRPIDQRHSTSGYIENMGYNQAIDDMKNQYDIVEKKK